MTAQRTTPLIKLLVNLGWQRDPGLWTVRCRDERGRRMFLRIHLTETGVTVSPSSPGQWAMTPLEVGRLRSALRDALLSLDQLGGLWPPGDPPVAMHAIEPASPPPGAEISLSRQRIRLDQFHRPSVAEIASRIAPTATADRRVLIPSTPSRGDR